MMSTDRRQLLKTSGATLAAGVGAGCISSLTGGGEGDYPNEEFILLNPYPPGGGTDIYFSQFVDPLSGVLGVNVRQEYETGANSANAMRRIQNTDSSHMATWQDVPIQTLLQFDLEDQEFDIREQRPICSVATMSVNLFVPFESDYTNFEELRQGYESGEISSIGGFGTGGSWHMACWLMKQEWDLNWSEYIGYDGGGPLSSAVVSGEVDAGIILGIAITDFVAEDKVKVVMTVGEESPDSIPGEVDTPDQFGLDATNVRAAGGQIMTSIWGPPALSDEERDILETEFIEMMNSDSIQNWSDESGRPIDGEEGSVVEDRLETTFGLEEEYSEFQGQI